MNKYTSSIVESKLEKLGYIKTNDEKEADLIIVNTCSVRSHAENRALGRLKTLSGLKKRNPELMIGIIGCMAKRLGDELFSIVPSLDFVIGPNDIGNIDEIIKKAKEERQIEISSTCLRYEPPIQSEISSYIPVSFGCSNFCSYCVVPFLWGRLRSRKKDDIIKEVGMLLENGVVEITLLGQDITSYGKDLNDGVFLSDILESCARLGVGRIRFITSHPKGMDDKIIQVVSENKNICPHFHLPLQSGSNRILSLMRRDYTIEYYYELVEKIRKKVPESSITTDLIIGFPTETKEEFEETLKAMEEIMFDAAFLFKYSQREGTSASYIKEELKEQDKIERLNEAISLANKVSRMRNEMLVGKTLDILVEGKNPKDNSSLFGKTATDKTVIFKGEEELAGKIVPVFIEGFSTYTLKGRLCPER